MIVATGTLTAPNTAPTRPGGTTPPKSAIEPNGPSGVVTCKPWPDYGEQRRRVTLMPEPHATVFFVSTAVVDGHAAVFGPVGKHLSVGQWVAAVDEDGNQHTATVTIVTPMDNRDLATIRLDGSWVAGG